MRNKSLIYRSCGQYTLCGISTRFQVLSPAQRQVAHALLTRPPLTFIRSKLPNQFVRLECVKHAASVHPEPGSNSLKKFKLSTYRRKFIYFRSLSFCSLLCCTFSVSQFLNRLTKLFSSLFVKRNCTSICSFFSRLLLFNFQGTYALRFRIACLLYHKLSLLSSTFFKFFQLFLYLFPSLRSCGVARGDFVSISEKLLFVKHFLIFFSIL